MKSLFAAIVLAAAVGTALPALARNELQRSQAEAVTLKDGSTLYLFKDGKMAREDKNGRAIRLRKGEVLEASDGRQITATSNESARLERLIKDDHRN